MTQKLQKCIQGHPILAEIFIPITIPGISTNLRQKRVNFINENDSWLPTACNTKQRPDEFLTFTNL
jgi:hypothetical protein